MRRHCKAFNIADNLQAKVLETIFCSRHLLIAYLDRDFNFIAVNDAYAGADRKKADYFPGRNYFDLYPNEEYQAIFQNVVKTGRAHIENSRPFCYPDHPERGLTFWDWTLDPVIDENGRVANLLLMLNEAELSSLSARTKLMPCGYEVTDHRKMELALNESEARFRRLAENARDVIFRMSIPDGVYEYISPASEKILGYRPEDIYRSPDIVRNIIHPNWRQYCRSLWENLLAGRVSPSNEYQIVHKSGEARWVNQRNVLIRDAAGNPVAIEGLVSDVTRRKRSEVALEKAAREWCACMDALDDAMYLLDLDRRILRANKAFYEMTGTSPEQAVGRHIAEIVHPRGEEALCPVCRSQEEKKDAIFTMEADHPGNPLGKPLESITKIIRDSGGAPMSILMSLRDLTNTRKDLEEKKRLEARLRQAQKMEAIGALAGGIAHDFNNILSPILCYSEIVLETLDSANPVYEDIEQIYMAGKRARELVKQILSFSRRNKEEFRPLQIQHIIREALNLLRSSIPSTIRIEKHIDNACPPVYADPSQIHQVIMNLCTNAYHVMREKGGILTVSLTRETINAQQTPDNPDFEPGGYVRLEVRDTGGGMPETIKQKIFDPYFTTKGAGEGTGLGLAIVQSVVENCRGKILVESQEGKGTSFLIYLPAIDGTAEESIENHRDSYPGGQEKVLLVDDDEVIVEMEEALLESLGYTVAGFIDAGEALAAFQNNPGGYDVLIIDMSMPDKNGLEVASECKKIRPDIPVILCAGFSEPAVPVGIASGVGEFLMKPVLKKDLALTMRKLLDDR